MDKISKKKVNYWNALKIAGAFIAFLLGSGFATGQETIQFFVAYGYKGILGALVTLFLFIYLCHSFYQTGYHYQLRKNEEVFVHYCGKFIGVTLTWYTMIFILLVHSIMLSGAGATVQEYYGFPTYIGAGGMAVLSLLTLLLGLKQLVNILANIGPVIIAVILFISLYIIIENPAAFFSKAEKIPDMEMLRATPYWWLSSLSYVGLSIGGLASFLPAIGANETNEKDLKVAAFIGPLFFVGAILLLSTALIIQIAEVQGKMIPVMTLAKLISPNLEPLFGIIILLGIYSTATPLLWTVVSRFAEDKTALYNSLVIVLTFLSFFGGMLLPFDQLLNLIYPTVGFAGILFLFFVIRKDVLTIMKK